jgi:hypothetical protein
LLIELLIEVVLLGILMGALLSKRDEFSKVALGAILALPVVLGLHFYYISRVLAVFVTWAGTVKWHYSGLAAAAFIAHASFIASQLWPDVTSRARAVVLPFLLGGAGIVYAVSFAGGYFFDRRQIVDYNDDHLVGGPLKEE